MKIRMIHKNFETEWTVTKISDTLTQVTQTSSDGSLTQDFSSYHAACVGLMKVLDFAQAEGFRFID